MYSTFTHNNNSRSLQPFRFLYRPGIFGVVLVIRFSVNFSGRNVFQSNFGSGVNINHARVTVQGLMEFYDHHGAKFGGAVRLGELTLVSWIISYETISSSLYVVIGVTILPYFSY